MSNKSQPPSVPPHLSEKNFRRYERVILQAVMAWPAPIRITPHQLAPTTYMARLRDALRSYELYRWPCGIPDGMEELIPKMRVWPSGQQVLLGPRQPTGPSHDVEEEVEEVPLDVPTRGRLIVNPSEDVVKAIVLLHGLRILTDPTKFTSYYLGESLLCYLEEQHDVQIVRQSDNEILVI